jgi:hypothetical protein
MGGWFKNIFSGRADGRRGDGRWQILIGRGIRITVPPGLPAETKWDVWGTIQMSILSEIKKHWPESHTYIRFNAFPPGYFTDKLQGCQYEVTRGKKDEIILLPDCEAPSALRTVFSVLGLIPFTRCVYILKDQPANWKEVMERLFEATQKIAKKQPVPEYEADLSRCHLLAYSIDQDLYIARIDIPQSEIEQLLEKVAHQEKLDLSIRMRK